MLPEGNILASELPALELARDNKARLAIDPAQRLPAELVAKVFHSTLPSEKWDVGHTAIIE